MRSYARTLAMAGALVAVRYRAGHGPTDRPAGDDPRQGQFEARAAEQEQVAGRSGTFSRAAPQVAIAVPVG
jgi:hypothetical protein